MVSLCAPDNVTAQSPGDVTGEWSAGAEWPAARRRGGLHVSPSAGGHQEVHHPPPAPGHAHAADRHPHRSDTGETLGYVQSLLKVSQIPADGTKKFGSPAVPAGGGAGSGDPGDLKLFGTARLVFAILLRETVRSHRPDGEGGSRLACVVIHCAN